MPRSFTFPVYQIDFAAVQAGKRMAATKRRIRWRFGFPNQQALAEGRTGTECRGEEHEVVIVWSITSGKRQILMDGREVHYSANRVGLLDFSWTMVGNHVLKTVCHAAPPLSPTPGFRQYDFFIDGQSFFNMPKVFELGVKGASADDNRIPGHPGSFTSAVSPRSVFSEAAGGYGNAYNGPHVVAAPRTRSEEDEYLQKAIQASLEESKSHLGGEQQSVVTSTASVEMDLLDFGGGSGDDPSSAPYDAYSAPAPAYNAAPAATYGTAPPSAYSGQPPSSYGAAPAAYGAAPTSHGYGAPTAYGGALTNGYGAGPAPAYASSYAPAGPPQPMLALPPSSNSGYALGGPSPADQYSGQSYGAPPPAAAPSSSYGAAPSSYYGGHQAGSNSASSAYGAPPPSTPVSYGGPPPSSSYPDPFAPSAGHSPGDPFAPRTPSHTNVTSDILKAYGSTPSSGQYQPGPSAYPGSNGAVYHPSSQPESPAYPTTPLSMSMNTTLTITEKEEKPLNPFEAAMKKLVNVDHIDEPAEEQLKLSMKKEEENRAVKNKNRSVPLPPAGKKVLGSAATLQDIAKVKPPPRMEPVIKPPPNLFNGGDPNMAGALTVYGQGPPPLQPQGFGVVHMQGRVPSAYYGGSPQYR